jgi:hypothetical protein
VVVGGDLRLHRPIAFLFGNRVSNALPTPCLRKPL